MEEDERISVLDRYYKEVHATMLSYQSHTLGLFPRGKSRHARVRDNVYCATALWCLSVAYRHVGDDKGRTHELEQSAVKCMRGLLFTYMRQADKVERFKHRQSWEDALHARFNCFTGDPVTGDDEWGHLQIDGTSLFLLMLAQMTASGVQIIFTKDEVDFIQNLVYYVERAYRIPDYGMWERGSRDNVGKRELHASSIGMTKAALEAMNGINLFGSQGSSLSVIHIDPDAQYRNGVILSNLLPRESSSKDTDVSLLCITGYPAFAIDDPALCQQTKQRVYEVLGHDSGHPTTYGFKRFLRDGHHTVRESNDKKYYKTSELGQFEGIECEWPLFYFIIILTELCRGHQQSANEYWKKLEKCLVEVDGHPIVPRLYFVPESELADDGVAPTGSLVTLKDMPYHMEPLVEEIPFQWAQALHLITRLTMEGFISLGELDPLGLHMSRYGRLMGMSRHLSFRAQRQDVVIQVALISETTRLQAILATHGIPTQTQKEVEPIKIKAPGDVLMKVFRHIGANKKLGLSGRPVRPIGALGTSKVYKIFGQTVVFYPTDSMSDFYTTYDVMSLIHHIKFTLTFLNLHWNMSCKPTVCLYLTENRLKGNNFGKFIKFLAEVKQGQVGVVKLRLDRLQALISTSSIERLDFEKDENLDRILYHKLCTPLRSSSTAYLSSASSEASLAGSMAGGGGGGGGIMDDADVFTMDQTELQQVENEGMREKEEEPEFSQADTKTYSTDHIKDLLMQPMNMLGELYLLHEIIKRNQLVYLNLHNMTVVERVEMIYDMAGERKHWKTVRLAAAILGKVVDTLAPSITSMLVRGKEITIGVFGYPEHIISEPVSPKELIKLIYDNCLPYDPIEAVLQQEIIINLGVFVSSTYRNMAFDHMLRVRIGWIIQAMKRERARTVADNKSVYHLPPYEVMQLLIQVLQDDESRSPLDQRQLNGALNCVPKNFYTKSFCVLERITGGIQVRGRCLPQVPTISELMAHEKGFALKVEELLSNITQPEYRQVIIEVIMVVATILERNPELNFDGLLDLDEILKHAQDMYKSDEQSRKKEELSQSGQHEDVDSPDNYPKTDDFYALNSDGSNGSTSFMARAVVNKLLKTGLQHNSSESCTIS